MKKTPFYSLEKEAGAKMVDYAGYEMPVSFSSIKEEHTRVRNKVGLFDVSHMGEFILKGEKALDLIQSLTTNDASKLTQGQAQYSCLTNEDGGIIDDLILYCIEENKVYMLVVNASNIEKDWKWIEKHNKENVEMHNVSDKTALLALQGPFAEPTLQKLLKEDISNIPYYQFIKTTLCGVKNVLISATGYTGAGGFEIYFEDEGDGADAIWNAIMEAGKEFDILPCGLGARDTLRLEMGYCLYGNDIDETTTPIEAGLGWITKFNKDFVAKDILKKQKEDGVSRKLRGFVMLEQGIPRKDYSIHDKDGNKIGFVTSGTQSPSTGKNIGMGYIDMANASLDSMIYVSIRDKMVQAVVHKFPFYNNP